MADETPPLDEARLAEIRRYWSEDMPDVRWNMQASAVVADASRDVAIVLAEVDRLRAREAAAMAIVRAVNDKGVYYTLQNGRRCYFCEAETDQFTSEPPHKSDCPVTKARALLGQSE